MCYQAKTAQVILLCLFFSVIGGEVSRISLYGITAKQKLWIILFIFAFSKNCPVSLLKKDFDGSQQEQELARLIRPNATELSEGSSLKIKTTKGWLVHFPMPAALRSWTQIKTSLWQSVNGSCGVQTLIYLIALAAFYYPVKDGKYLTWLDLGFDICYD